MLTRFFLLMACLIAAAVLPAFAEPRAWSGDGNFSLIPPSGWTVTRPARNILFFAFGKAEMEIECFSEPVPITDPDYKSKIATSVDTKEFAVKSQADTKISGMDAVQCELEGVGKMKDVVGRLVVLTDRHRTWFINYSAPRDEAPEAFGRIEEALISLQLK